MTAQDLKNSILQLAIQGKLVEQRVEEGTAKELVEQIKAEKEQLIKEKKIKKEKLLPEITEEEIPFEIPESWEWVRFSEIMDVRDGTHDTPRYVTEGVPLVTSKNLVNGTIDYDNVKLISQEDSEKINERSGVDNGDILFAMIGSIGNPVLVKKEREFSIKNMALFKPINSTAFNMTYLFWYLQKEQNIMKKKATGGVQSFVSLSFLRSYLIPLPPFEEQKRIVKKIEELLPYIEQYDKAYSKLEVLNEKFPEDMQKSILQYAIQGKLVEQRPEEGTAEELYQQIQAEKESLIKKGKIKKEKPLSEITEDEIPFEIPESWKWMRLGHITTYGQTKTKITAKNILPEMWSLDLEDIEKVTGRIIERKKACERKIVGDKVQFEKGNILYSKLRPYLLKILIADADGICTPELVPFSSYGNIEDKYLLWVLKSPYVDYIINTVTYGVKMPRVGTDTMVNLLIPLPPLVEQKRIVDAIESYLPYCQQLLN